MNIERPHYFFEVAETWWRSATNRGILAAILTVGSVTAAIKVVSLFREMTVAHAFGTGDNLDAFLIAIIPTSFAINVQIAALSAALMPTYIRTREKEGDAAARRLAENSVTILAAMLLLTTVVLLFLGEPLIGIIGSGFDEQKQAKTLELFYFLLPIIFLQGSIKIFGTFVNASERFGVIAAAPAATPVLTIGLLLATNRDDAQLLVLGVVGGAAIELAVVLAFARRTGVFVWPRWHGLDESTRRVIWQYLPTMLGALSGGAAWMVDQSMAAMLDPGSVASLNYGTKAVALVLTLSAGPISTAVLPYLSQLAAVGDAVQLRRSLVGWIAIILPISLLISAALFWGAEPLTRLFLERGAFGASDTATVAQLQALYALQIPFFLIGILAARVINAMSMNQITAIVGIMNLVTNIGFNLLFIEWMGLPGIALATTVVYMISMFVNLLIVSILLRRLEWRESGTGDGAQN